MVSKIFIFVFIIITKSSVLVVIGQENNKNQWQKDTLKSEVHEKKYEYPKSLVGTLVSIGTPVALVSYGLATMKDHHPESLNQLIKIGLQEDTPHYMKIDDYSQYTPLVSVFALDLFGVKAKHSLRERIFTGTVSHLIMAGIVNIMKGTFDVRRPDGRGNNSFPSGHTATVFVGAEMLWQEYREQSIWYGIGGYTIATATGFFRMYNNRHWFSDITMGAGIGIMSAKIAYWLLPLLPDKSIGKAKRYSIIPEYNGRDVSIALRFDF